MNIQPISTSMGVSSCQPIRPVNFLGKKVKPVEENPPVTPEDSFAPSDPRTMEQKYDLACRVAAYYKTQYENLIENGSCIA